jgi:hypothetical protein
MSNEKVSFKIAEIIKSYRDGEFGVYDCDHVKRWISQFQVDERSVVLIETYKILERNYFTKKNFLEFIDTIIKSQGIKNEIGESYWRKVSLLNIQKNGKSQTELNEIFGRKLFNLYKISNFSKELSSEYIYLDDFIFSGGRLFADMSEWISKKAPNKCNICIITIGVFTSSIWQIDIKLKDLVKKLGKNINFTFKCFGTFRLKNKLVEKDHSEVFWPTESITQLDGYPQFLIKERFSPEYRNKNNDENRIFSITNREEYEKIIFKYGLKIMSFSSKNSSVVKPLGYSTYRGFGFGSTIFSFRNCPNNNPLVFWWGNPTAKSSHPFSKWYPLFQRKTYDT